MRAICAVAAVAALFLGVSCSDTGVATPQAKPYEVVGSDDLSPTNGRTARHWHIVSESYTFEEHAQTVARAASDLQREHCLDLTQVSLYPGRSLAGSSVKYGYGFYATDGRAGQGLPGADPEYRATWRVYAAERAFTSDELAIAELWIERAPDFPSTDMLSSLLVDAEALRSHVSEELGLPYEDVEFSHPRLELWLEILE